ncbi:hypothetical protein V1520DRAFT_187611 [Lipomyces starkeyi]
MARGCVCSSPAERIRNKISLAGSDKRPWDYRELFNLHAAMYRVLCMLIAPTFASWSGGEVGY